MTMGEVPINMIGARSLRVSNGRLGRMLGFTTWLSNTRRNVAPSGAAVAAAWVPIAPAAPLSGRKSCRSCRSRASLAQRAWRAGQHGYRRPCRSWRLASRRSIGHLAHQLERPPVEIGLMADFATLATLAGVHQEQPASRHSGRSALLGIKRD